jgi:prepilin-type N-terminal cleavage/methylation domain-containing protein
MNCELKKNGFSLTEVLLAVGILAIGLVFIAGTFPVGIGLTTVAAERTVAAVAADEAFAKIRLYGINPLNLLTQEFEDFNDVALTQPDPNEFAYPSVETGLLHSYYWSALCRRVDTDSRRVQVTVFVCRKTGVHTKYPKDDPDVAVYDWPRPVPVRNARGAFRITGSGNQLRLHPTMMKKKVFFIAGSTIITEPRGGIYRVLDRLLNPDFVLKLDRDVQDQDMVDIDDGDTNAWVVPPAVGGGRNPVIGVYQRIIKF